MRTRALIALVVAVLLGVGAAIATYDLSRGHRTPIANNDSEPGLTP